MLIELHTRFEGGKWRCWVGDFGVMGEGETIPEAENVALDAFRTKFQSSVNVKVVEI